MNNGQKKKTSVSTVYFRFFKPFIKTIKVNFYFKIFNIVLARSFWDHSFSSLQTFQNYFKIISRSVNEVSPIFVQCWSITTLLQKCGKQEKLIKMSLVDQLYCLQIVKNFKKETISPENIEASIESLTMQSVDLSVAKC